MTYRNAKNILLLTFIFSLLGMLGGCGEPENEKPGKPRPVLAFRVGEQAAVGGARFAGVVWPRFQTPLAFRVAGKLMSRQVNDGDSVHKGQLLANLDGTDYQLAALALKAQLNSAEQELTFSKANLSRFQELFGQKLISQPELDRNKTNYNITKEQVSALKAQYEQALNQLAYTSLFSDRDGVITELSMETGQVVQAGQVVVQVAKHDEQDVLINVPEQLINQIHIGQKTKVSLWVDEARELLGEVREMAMAAESASRTYAVKVRILGNCGCTRLGMSATVLLLLKQAQQMSVPLSALFTLATNTQQNRVWVVDEKNLTVSSVAIELGQATTGEQMVAYGLKPGQLIVSTGTHRLAEGQRVSVLENSAGDE